MSEFVAKRITSNLEILRKISSEVEIPLSNKDKKHALYLLEYLIRADDERFATLHKMKAGVGLASIQLGVDKRMFAINYTSDEKDENQVSLSKVFINPKIVSYSKGYCFLRSGERCLSVPKDVNGLVKRHLYVKIRYFDLDKNEYVVEKYSGYLGIIVQHEYDHLDGKLYYDNITDDQDIIDNGTIIKV